MDKKYKIIEQKTLPDCEIEISAELPFELVADSRKEAIKELLKTAEMPGFRKGHVPEEVYLKKVGDLTILYEAADFALKKIVPDMIADLKIQIVGYPQISITKCAEGNPLGFKLTVATLPEIKLPDYKAIAKKENSKKAEEIKVEDKEVDEVVNYLRHQTLHQKMKAEGKEEPKGKHSHDDKDLPVLDDSLVKTLGNFKDVADFKNQIKNNILKDKELKNKDKRRLTIAEAIMAKTDLPLPKVLVENELNKMSAQFQHNVEQTGLKIDDYLKHLKKDWATIREEWRSDASKRAKLELLLFEISKTENLKPTDESIEAEVKHLLEVNKEADPIRARAYVETILTNEKIFAFLESQK